MSIKHYTSNMLTSTTGLILGLLVVYWVHICQTQPQISIPFNLDLRFPISLPTESLQNELRTRNGNFPTLFSSSIVATPETNKRIRRQNVFIGSPNLKSRKNKTLVTGGVFKCSLDWNNENLSPKCDEIQLRNDDTALFFSENKTKSLVGFTLGRTMTDVISCAPNYVGINDTPEGLCFVLEAETGHAQAVFKHDKTRLIENNRPYDSHNLFGFSYAFNNIADEIILGMPGHVDFTGAVVTVNNELNSQLTNNIKSQVNTYLSYSLAFSAFDKDEGQTIIASWPKFNKFNGKVDLIDYSSGSVVQSLHGHNDSFGEYFGASLLVTDVDKNERGDLFVGAPFYSLNNRRELGRVYWYSNFKETKRPQLQIIMAKAPKVGSRFGTNLAAIDLNRDSFQDVIISAPFEESLFQSTGTIYIYYGSANGLNIGNEKRIEASFLSGKRILQGFGYSLWTSNDIDNNGYQDLIIGSLLSENVSILRGIPIIKLNLTLEFDRKGIDFSNHSTCPSSTSCFRVAYCVLTDSKELFKQDLSYHVELTVSDRKLRLKENRVRLAKQTAVIKSRLNRICQTSNEGFLIELKDKEEISDIITPIEVRLEANLINENENAPRFCSDCPISSPSIIFRDIGFEHGCAKKICEANLSLKVGIRYGPYQLKDVLIQGLYDTLDVSVQVNNIGESSIDTLLAIQMRPFMLQLIDNVDSRRCRLDVRINQFLCDVNRLLQTNQTEEMLLRFDTSEMNAKNLRIDLRLESNSVIKEASIVSQSADIIISKQAYFELNHSSFFQNDTFSDQTQKKTFQLSYIINKRGPSTVNNTYLQLYLPSNIIDIDQVYPFKCFRVGFGKGRISKLHLINETLTVNCTEDTEACSKYECNLYRFPSEYKSFNIDLTLALYPTKISSQIKYSNFQFNIKSYLTTTDILMTDTLLTSTQTEFIFQKQSTELKSKSSPLIMFGGAGVGLLLLLLTTVILIKKGFFRRKKREELMRVRQRMSMNPNMFANVNIET